MAQTQTPPLDQVPTEAKNPDEVEREITLGIEPKTDFQRLLIASRRDFYQRNGRF